MTTDQKTLACCLWRLLAMQQPMASHLRVILAVIKINADLERVVAASAAQAQRRGNSQSSRSRKFVGEFLTTTIWSLYKDSAWI